jgi:hypothetical protein
MLLSLEEAALFLSLYLSLIGFAAGRLGGVAGIVDVKTFRSASNQSRTKARDRLLDNIPLINAFIEENPDGFSEKQLFNVTKWEHFVRGGFFIEWDLMSYTVFLDDGEPPKSYGVLGLTDEIIELVPYPLPVMVSAVLLPWKGQIICDGLILVYAVVLGRGIRSNLAELYRQTKEQGIITSLDPD